MIKLHNIAFLLLLAACSSAPREKAPAETATSAQTVKLTAAQAKNAAIVTGKVQQKMISRILHVNGKIDVPPQNMVSVSVPLGGFLKSTQLMAGMHVRKGEVIATMEDQQYIQLQQDYLIAQAKLTYVEKEFERQRELNLSKATSDKIFQQTESEFITQKVMVKSLSEKLKLISIDPARLSENTISKSISIFSPIDGYVTHVNVNIGKYTQPSEVLFELVNPADIHLALNVFEKDLDDIYIGQKLVAFNNRNPEDKHLCEIILIGKNLSADRNAEVHCHFEKYDERLIPGMYMNAEIDLKNSPSDVLPEDAIVMFEGHQYVFIEQAPNAYVMQEVTSGSTELGFTQILEGLSEIGNKPVVLKGAYTLLMQLKNTSEE